jgi:hypothetical protein
MFFYILLKQFYLAVTVWDTRGKFKIPKPLYQSPVEEPFASLWAEKARAALSDHNKL